MSLLSDYSFRCGCCEEEHVGLPELAFRLPDLCARIPAAEREGRVQATSETCVLDDEHYFIRAVLPVPVLDAQGVRLEDEYNWGVWVSLSQRNFLRYQELFDVDPPEGEGRYFGWLCSEIPYYPMDDALATMVHLRGDSQRPRVVLQPTEHLLAVHQREGVPITQLIEWMTPYLHPPSEA